MAELNANGMTALGCGQSFRYLIRTKVEFNNLSGSANSDNGYIFYSTERQHICFITTHRIICPTCNSRCQNQIVIRIGGGCGGIFFSN